MLLFPESWIRILECYRIFYGKGSRNEWYEDADLTSWDLLCWELLCSSLTYCSLILDIFLNFADSLFYNVQLLSLTCHVSKIFLWYCGNFGLFREYDIETDLILMHSMLNLQYSEVKLYFLDGVSARDHLFPTAVTILCYVYRALYK